MSLLRRLLFKRSFLRDEFARVQFLTAYVLQFKILYRPLFTQSRSDFRFKRLPLYNFAPLQQKNILLLHIPLVCLNIKVFVWWFVTHFINFNNSNNKNIAGKRENFIIHSIFHVECNCFVLFNVNYIVMHTADKWEH